MEINSNLGRKYLNNILVFPGNSAGDLLEGWLSDLNSRVAGDLKRSRIESPGLYVHLQYQGRAGQRGKKKNAT